jgi:hypothetical protein
MLKYPSNIIEKFLEKNYEIGLLKFIEEICLKDNIAGKYILKIKNLLNFLILELIRSNYGNYVVQKALRISKDSVKKKMIFAILSNLEKIKESRLIVKWRNILLMNLPSSDEIDGEEMKMMLLMIYGNGNVNMNMNGKNNLIVN